MGDKPVVVGIDGSPDSKQALEWAVEYGRRYDAPVHAVTSWDIPPSFGYPIVFDDDDVSALQSQANTVLDDAVRDLPGENSPVIKRLVRGHAATSLVRAATSAQLLVVGSRGRGAFAGMLLGSVSQHCVHHASCPVVVVPHYDTAETPTRDS